MTTTRIGILGDTHSNTNWVVNYALGRFQRENIRNIVQVGDFGIWPGEYGGRFVKRVNIELEKNDQDLWVTPGNHDDYDRIETLLEDPDGWLILAPRIRVAPRGHRWSWENRTFVSLGGAPSVDRTWRLKSMGINPLVAKAVGTDFVNISAVKPLKRSWWPQEFITDEDVRRVAEGGHADVMITHDAPNGIETISRRIAGNPFSFQPWDLEYADRGRVQMDKAFRAVAPSVFLHGHYHFHVDETLELNAGLSDLDTEITKCHVVGLGCDGGPFSLGVLNLEDLSAEAWDNVLQDAREHAK